MAYGVVHYFAGGTKEQYEASLAAVHPGDGLRLQAGIDGGFGAPPEETVIDLYRVMP